MLRRRPRGDCDADPAEPNSPVPVLLSVSIVIFRPDAVLLAATLESVVIAFAELKSRLPGTEGRIFLVDNADASEGVSARRVLLDKGLPTQALAIEVIEGHGNVGYGRGHNLAFHRSDATYHLVLNPDVRMDRDALWSALTFLDAHPEAALLAPFTANAAGTQEFLCKRYPSILDLLVRGFVSGALRQPFEGRLARYEMRSEMSAGTVVWDPPLVSGCFMLFPSKVLKQLGGFTPSYFLYFEDYDLSIRAARIAKNVYVPAVRIIHYGGGAAKKGWAHRRMFLVSAWTFFNTHGWRLF
jgi:GT2 family glycosyltransferase